MVKVYLCTGNMNNAVLIPVTPPEITISSGVNVRTYETAANGIITQIGFTEPCGVSFSSFFPSTEREYSLNNKMFGMEYVHYINQFTTWRSPCRVIIVGMDFDRNMIVERFEYRRKQGNDVYYSLSLTEKRSVV